MLRRALLIGLLSSMALPSRAGEEKEPPKAPPPYFKVETRGKLRIEKGTPGSFEPLKLVKQPVRATVFASGIGMALDLGDDKELAALAKKLDGKAVLIVGELVRAAEKELSGYPSREFEPRIAVEPPHSRHPRVRFVDYIKVTSLKLAE
jgi:hypothetical protein